MEKSGKVKGLIYGHGGSGLSNKDDFGAGGDGFKASYIGPGWSSERMMGTVSGGGRVLDGYIGP